MIRCFTAACSRRTVRPPTYPPDHSINRSCSIRRRHRGKAHVRSDSLDQARGSRANDGNSTLSSSCFASRSGVVVHATKRTIPPEAICDSVAIKTCGRTLASPPSSGGHSNQKICPCWIGARPTSATIRRVVSAHLGRVASAHALSASAITNSWFASNQALSSRSVWGRFGAPPFRFRCNGSHRNPISWPMPGSRPHAYAVGTAGIAVACVAACLMNHSPPICEGQ